MNTNRDYRINYEWEARRNQLDFEIQQIQTQLKSVENRLHFLKTDIYSYLIMIIVPFLLIAFGSLLTLGTGFDIITSLISALYTIALPFIVYNLIKTILLNILNNRTTDFTPPAIRTPYQPKTPKRELTYNIEKQKLAWILTKYYRYRDIYDDMKRQMEEGSFSMTLEEMQAKFDELPYYETIRPASPFVGDMVKKSHLITSACLGFALVVSLSLAIWG